jgi:hypothetical protein
MSNSTAGGEHGHKQDESPQHGVRIDALTAEPRVLDL